MIDIKNLIAFRDEMTKIAMPNPQAKDNLDKIPITPELAEQVRKAGGKASVKPKEAPKKVSKRFKLPKDYKAPPTLKGADYKTRAMFIQSQGGDPNDRKTWNKNVRSAMNDWWSDRRDQKAKARAAAKAKPKGGESWAPGATAEQKAQLRAGKPAGKPAAAPTTKPKATPAAAPKPAANPATRLTPFMSEKPPAPKPGVVPAGAGGSGDKAKALAAATKPKPAAKPNLGESSVTPAAERAYRLGESSVTPAAEKRWRQSQPAATAGRNLEFSRRQPGGGIAFGEGQNMSRFSPQVLRGLSNMAAQAGYVGPAAPKLQAPKLQAPKPAAKPISQVAKPIVPKVTGGVKPGIVGPPAPKAPAAPAAVKPAPATKPPVIPRRGGGVVILSPPEKALKPVKPVKPTGSPGRPKVAVSPRVPGTVGSNLAVPTPGT